MSTSRPHVNAPTVRPVLNAVERLPIFASATYQPVSELKPRNTSSPRAPALTAHSELLLDRRADETECLGPAEVEKVAEAAQEEDAPLVSAHAHETAASVRTARLQLRRMTGSLSEQTSVEAPERHWLPPRPLTRAPGSPTPISSHTGSAH
jgi:hypothetical protein